MKIWDIIKNVGAGVIKEVIPGGSLIVGAINELLPEDKKLSKNATGEDVNRTVASLPAPDRAKILEKELDIEITQIKESNSTVRAMLESDAKSPHTTRPYIAKGSFHIIAFSCVICISVWAYGVLIKDSELIKTVMDGWQFILAIIGPLVTLLWAYFGILKTEHKQKLNAANGEINHGGITSLISNLISRK